MKTSVRLNRRAFQFFAGWFALLLYMDVASPLGMGLTALVGAFDPDHHALVQTGLGSTRLILRHEPKCVAHHHGVVARALTLFAEPVRPGQLDHVLQFSTTLSFSHPAQISAPSPALLQLPVLALTGTPAGLSHLDFFLSLAPSPPPDVCGRLVCLRSTLLLI